MFAYHLKLALLSVRRNPVLSGLMMLAIAVGIGAFMTMLTVYHIQAGNPAWFKNEQIYAVQLDTWDPTEPFDDNKPEIAPDQLTYRDAMALQQSDIPTYKTAMFKMGGIIQPENPEVAPFQSVGRMAYNDFFRIFEVPFLYGSAWGDAADNSSDFVIVLSKELNRKLFGGVDSTGRKVRVDEYEYTVAGVIDEWEPRPKYYDLTNGAFQGGESFYIPLSLVATLEQYSWGNTNCWKSETQETFQDRLNGECIWLQYWVQLDTAEQRERYRSFLGAYLQEQAELGRSGRPDNFDIKTPEQWLAFNEVVDDDNRVLVGLSFLFLIVCLLNTVGLLLAKFRGKAGDISIRRALGASRLGIFRQQLTECGCIGLLGGVLGLGLTGLGLLAVKRMYDYEGSVLMDGEMITIAFVTAVLASIAAGLWPAWQICRVPPAGYLKTQ